MKDLDKVDLFSQTLRNLGPSRLLALGSVAIGILGFFFYLINQSSHPDMALLFNTVEPADGAKIVDKIESMGIPVEIKGDGTQIFVPRDKVARLRMEVAQEGLPSGGVVGYELFDRSDVLGSASNVMDINHLRALEGEISKSIQTIQGVGNARVHLVLPKRELFSRDKVSPSASIVLKMKGANRLNASQVQAIQHLVASSVQDLNPDKVSIIDDKGTLLAKSLEGPDSAFNGSNNQDLKRGQEEKIAKTIESLLEKSVGYGKVKAEVTTEMDFDRITLNSEEYNPEGQVVRSTSTVEDGANSSEQASEQGVSVQNALPNQNTAAGEGNKNTNQSKRNEENTTYEISKTIKTHVKETGTIKRLSVAVLVDGVYTPGKDGKMAYAPRPKEEIDQLTNLIKTAIGFKEDRGDSVQVINMKFIPLDEQFPVTDAAPKVNLMEKINLSKLIELAVLSIVGILVMMLVVRPLILKLIEKTPQQSTLDDDLMAALEQTQTPAISAVLPSPNQDVDVETLDLQNIEGKVRASSIRRVGKMVEQSPEDAVGVLRGWMYSQG